MSQTLSMKPKSAGLGMAIEMNKVIEIIPGGRADADGRIRLGDELVSINDLDVSSLHTHTISQRLEWAKSAEQTKLTFRRQFVGRGNPEHIFDVILQGTGDVVSPYRHTSTPIMHDPRMTIPSSHDPRSTGGSGVSPARISMDRPQTLEDDQNLFPRPPSLYASVRPDVGSTYNTKIAKQSPAKELQVETAGLAMFNELASENERFLQFIRSGGMERMGAYEELVLDSKFLMSDSTEAGVLRSLYASVKAIVDEKEALKARLNNFQAHDAAVVIEPSIEEMVAKTGAPQGDVQAAIIHMMKGLERSQQRIKDFEAFHADAMEKKDAERDQLRKEMEAMLQSKEEEKEGLQQSLDEFRKKFRRNSTTHIKLLDEDMTDLKKVLKEKDQEIADNHERIRQLESDMRDRAIRVRAATESIHAKRKEDDMIVEQMKKQLAERDSIIQLLRGARGVNAVQ